MASRLSQWRYSLKAPGWFSYADWMTPIVETNLGSVAGHTLPCHGPAWVMLGRQKGWVLVSQPLSPQSAWGWAVISSQSGGHGIPDGHPALQDGPIAIPGFQGPGFCTSKGVITDPREPCCIGGKCAGGRRRRAFHQRGIH